MQIDFCKWLGFLLLLWIFHRMRLGILFAEDPFDDYYNNAPFKYIFSQFLVVL